MNRKAKNLATEGTEVTGEISTVRRCRYGSCGITNAGEQTSRYCATTFSVTSVFSDMTTSHSTRLPNNASQVDGYVAEGFSE